MSGLYLAAAYVLYREAVQDCVCTKNRNKSFTEKFLKLGSEIIQTLIS